MYGNDENAWKPVVIHGKKNTIKQQQQQNVSSEVVKKTHTGNNLSKSLYEDDIVVQDKVTLEFRKEFQKRRLDCKRTQEQLAKEARNLKDSLKAIKNLENGKVTMKEAIQIAISVRHIIGQIKH